MKTNITQEKHVQAIILQIGVTRAHEILGAHTLEDDPFIAAEQVMQLHRKMQKANRAFFDLVEF